MAYFRALTGGGSGGISNVATGVETLTASQQKTISTGLSSVTKFTIVLTPKAESSYYWGNSCVYDKDVSSSKYLTFSWNGTTAHGASPSVGSSSGNDRLTSIKSVSGGDVTVIAPSSSSFCGDYYWYAE